MGQFKYGKGIEKLACDRCDTELTEPQDIELALEGAEAWQAAFRARGVEPRGVYPCQNYVRCGGEMMVVLSGHRWLPRLFSR